MSKVEARALDKLSSILRTDVRSILGRRDFTRVGAAASAIAGGIWSGPHGSIAQAASDDPGSALLVDSAMPGQEQLPEGVDPEPQVVPEDGQPGMAGASPELLVDGNVATYQFAWSQVYVDPPQYMRTLGAGISAVPIAKGAYPAGYRIANGQPGGGFPPAGAQSNGTLPIRIQPPVFGTGRITFVTHLKVRVGNPGRTVVEASGGLGVSNSSQVSRPMFPYLGVAHDQDPISGGLVNVTIPPRSVVEFLAFRLDIVDNAFATVPNWPNWRMDPGVTNRLWPAVTPIANVKSGSVQVWNVFTFGFAT